MSTPLIVSVICVGSWIGAFIAGRIEARCLRHLAPRPGQLVRLNPRIFC